MSELSLFPSILCIDVAAVLLEAKPQLKKEINFYQIVEKQT